MPPFEPHAVLNVEVAMQITASVKNAGPSHDVTVATAGTPTRLAVPAKSVGQGSGVNGGEFLMLALATCYCNDIYREAARMGIEVSSVEVEATAEFTGIGLAASNIRYGARIASTATDEQIATLLEDTDAVAEIQNTVRAGASVTRLPWE
jgi:organic hydroperoxide reductase OsmC/OhrA